MSRPTMAKWMCWMTALLPFFCADVATILYMIGGFGGGHGRFDDWLYVLGCPSIVLVSRGLLLPPFEMNDLLLIVWYPALLNFLLWWGPIALGLRYCTRNWQSAWQVDRSATTTPRLLVDESHRIDDWLQRVDGEITVHD